MIIDIIYLTTLIALIVFSFLYGVSLFFRNSEDGAVIAKVIFVLFTLVFLGSIILSQGVFVIVIFFVSTLFWLLNVLFIVKP